MIALTEYDDFGTLNGHAIIGSWIAFISGGELRTGKITGVGKTGVTRDDFIPYRQDKIIIDDGKYEIPAEDDDWYRYPVVTIRTPCTRACCRK